MKKLVLSAASLALAGLFSNSHAATGIPWFDNNTNLTVYADLRLRYELDWDSHTAAGVERDDRHRGRVRARVGFDYKFSNGWSIGSRLRTGDSRSQQSPHLTFWNDDGPRDELDFVLDRYYVQYKEGKITSWAGRNVTPFWQQNELFWDEDVTPTGLAASYAEKIGDGTLTGTVGGFFLPDGGYDLNGQMVAGQLRYGLPIGPGQVTTAGGLFFMNGDDGANNLLDRNGDRDYLIGVLNAQWSQPVNEYPLTFGADLFHNFENYSAAEAAPFPAADSDEDLGYVLSVTYGQLKEKNDWMVGYYWSHIETFSVNASYAQDDWHRFGTPTQTRASDFEGHEFRVAYALSKNINLVARLYLVEAITTGQDGNRFRLDLNWKF